MDWTGVDWTALHSAVQCRVVRCCAVHDPTWPPACRALTAYGTPTAWVCRLDEARLRAEAAECERMEAARLQTTEEQQMEAARHRALEQDRVDMVQAARRRTLEQEHIKAPVATSPRDDVLEVPGDVQGGTGRNREAQGGVGGGYELV